MGDISEQLGLLPEGADQCLSALHRAQPTAGVMLELGEVLRAEVGHRMPLEVGPDVFDRVEFWGVRRQVLEGNGPTLGFHVLAHQAGAVSSKVVPDDQEFPPNSVGERFEELNYLWCFDRAREEAEVKAHEARPGDHRELLPTEGVLENRSLTFGSPGACATGTLGESRLVYEDDDSSLSRCDFFKAGHLLFFQSVIARSLRSRALPDGRCGLHPIRCSVRHTEAVESFSPKRSWISAPMRGSVQISVAYPAETAPCLSSFASSFSCSSERRKRPPRRPTLAMRSNPPCANAFSQRITDWRDTERARATCAGFSVSRQSVMRWEKA